MSHYSIYTDIKQRMYTRMNNKENRKFATFSWLRQAFELFLWGTAGSNIKHKENETHNSKVCCSNWNI